MNIKKTNLLGIVNLADPIFDVGENSGIEFGLKQVFQYLTGSGIIRNDNLIAVVLGWVNFFLVLLGTAAFVSFVWAGGLYLTAFANEQNAEKAKKIMQFSGIGIIVILMSYALVSTLIRATI